jgi:hypothetical protein
VWLFTPFGFFSAVAHRDDPNLLCVRARDRASLEELLVRFPDMPAELVDAAIQNTPDADYPWRIIAKRRAFAAVLEAFVLDGLDYDNFKSEAAREHGRRPGRLRALHDVWDVMHGVTEPDARPAPPSRARHF